VTAIGTALAITEVHFLARRHPATRGSCLQQLPQSVQILQVALWEPSRAAVRSLVAGALKLKLPLWTRTCMNELRRRTIVLWTLFVVLLVLWALGMVTSYTAGGLIHILLVLGLVVLVIRLIQGRRVIG
jgi:hypothetical protein